MSDKVKRFIAIAWLTLVVGSVVTVCGTIAYGLYQNNEAFRVLTEVMALLLTICLVVFLIFWSLGIILDKDN